MRVQISKWGNSAALRLPKAVVDELGLKPGQEMELVVVQGEARLKAVRKLPFYRIEDLAAEMKRLGRDYEPKLEPWGPDVGAEVIDDDNSGH